MQNCVTEMKERRTIVKAAEKFAVRRVIIYFRRNAVP